MLGLTFASFRAHLVPSHPFDVRCCVSSRASTCPFLGRWTIIPSLPACVLLTAPAVFVSSDALTSAIRRYPSDPTLPLSGLFCRPPSWSVVRPTRAHLPFACVRARHSFTMLAVVAPISHLYHPHKHTHSFPASFLSPSSSLCLSLPSPFGPALSLTRVVALRLVALAAHPPLVDLLSSSHL